VFEPSPEPARSLTPGERRIYWGFSLFLLGCFVADVVSNFEPAKLSILFMLLAWPPLLVLHEAGHAILSHTLGWKIDGIVIGFGRPVAALRVAGVGVEIRSLPVEGFVRCRPVDMQGVRWKSAAIYFAGPGVELAFALLILLLVGGDSLLTRSAEPAIIALQSAALAAVMGAVLNLIPHSTISTQGEVLNDGLGILWSLQRPLSEWEAEIRARRYFDEDAD
jgi:hypothetical protein